MTSRNNRHNPKIIVAHYFETKGGDLPIMPHHIKSYSRHSTGTSLVARQRREQFMRPLICRQINQVLSFPLDCLLIPSFCTHISTGGWKWSFYCYLWRLLDMETCLSVLGQIDFIFITDAQRSSFFVYLNRKRKNSNLKLVLRRSCKL